MRPRLSNCTPTMMKQRPEQQQRALADRVVEHELVDREVELHQHADEDEERAEAAEEVLRPVLVPAEEHHREQIQVAAHVGAAIRTSSDRRCGAGGSP